MAGGYLTEAASWRWIFWVIVIAMGVLILASPFLLRETYAPVILERKVARMRKSLNIAEQQLRIHEGTAASKFTVVRSAFLRPFVIFSSPIVLIISVYVACVYAYQYLMFSTLASIYQAQYKLSVGTSGLIYLGTGIGTILGKSHNGEALYARKLTYLQP